MGFGRVGRIRRFPVRMIWGQGTQRMYRPRSSAQGLTTESCIPLPSARVLPTLARENIHSHHPFPTAAFPRPHTTPFPFPWGVGPTQQASFILLSQVP